MHLKNIICKMLSILSQPQHVIVNHLSRWAMQSSSVPTYRFIDLRGIWLEWPFHLIMSPFCDRCKDHYSGVTWAPRHLISLTMLLFVQQLVNNRPITRKHQSSALLTLREGNPVDSFHNRPLMWNAFPCHGVITVETLYNTINFCWSTHKRHSIARPQGRGMGCLLWVQRATYCVDSSKLSSIKYLL